MTQPAGPDPQVDLFCHQYLQLEKDLDYPGEELLRKEETQDGLYSRLFSGTALSHPPPVRYQLRVLKELVARIESSIDDWEQHGIHDGLMESMTILLAQPLPSEAVAAQQKSYVSYYLSGLEMPDNHAQPAITILESRFLISAGGTTGLRTWEAALHLGQYLCARPDIVKSKRVLELGAGTGYLSILCAKYLGAQHVLASDGSEDVVNNLPESFYLNGLQGSEAVTATELLWGHALLGTEEAEWNGGRPVDVVLGADITYDSSVIPSLVATLEELVSLHPRVDIIISATERNRETFETFKGVTAKAGFAVETVDFPITPRKEQRGPFYSDSVPIHICRLRRQG